jgi:hypothetical protein
MRGLLALANRDRELIREEWDEEREAWEQRDAAMQSELMRGRDLEAMLRNDAERYSKGVANALKTHAAAKASWERREDQFLAELQEAHEECLTGTPQKLRTALEELEREREIGIVLRRERQIEVRLAEEAQETFLREQLSWGQREDVLRREIRAAEQRSPANPEALTRARDELAEIRRESAQRRSQVKALENELQQSKLGAAKMKHDLWGQRNNHVEEVHRLRDELEQKEKDLEDFVRKEKEATTVLERDHKSAMLRMERSLNAADRDFYDVVASKKSIVASMDKKADLMSKNAIAVANSGAGSSSDGPRRDLFLAKERAGEVGQAANGAK